MKYFDLMIEFPEEGKFYIVICKKGTVSNFDELLNFPPSLILPAVLKDELHLTYSLGNYHYMMGSCIYNKNNIFSKWIIKNQDILQEKVPGIYQQIIKCMLYPNKFIENINAILKHLRQIPKLGIEIAKDLTEGDFI